MASRKACFSNFDDVNKIVLTEQQVVFIYLCIYVFTALMWLL